jgi:hypothetical protein
MKFKYFIFAILICIIFFICSKKIWSIDSVEKLTATNHSSAHGAAGNDGSNIINNSDSRSSSRNSLSKNGNNSKSEYGKIIALIQNGQLSISEFFDLCDSYDKSNPNTTHVKDFVDYYLMSDQYSIEDKLSLLNNMDGNMLFLNEIKLYATLFVEGLIKQGSDWQHINDSCNGINNVDSKMAAYEKLYKSQYGKMDQLKFLVSDEKRISQIREVAAIQNAVISGDSISSRFFANVFTYAWENSPQDTESYAEIMNAIESLNIEERFKNLIVWKFSGKNRKYFDDWRDSKGKYLNLNEAELKRMYSN